MTYLTKILKILSTVTGIKIKLKEVKNTKTARRKGFFLKYYSYTYQSYLTIYIAYVNHSFEYLQMNEKSLRWM